MVPKNKAPRPQVLLLWRLALGRGKGLVLAGVPLCVGPCDLGLIPELQSLRFFFLAVSVKIIIFLG